MPAKTMSKKDRQAWIAKSERLNADHEIATGDRVRDFLLREGVVTRVVKANHDNPLEDHGTVEVRLDSTELEHFTHTSWKTQLRRLS